MEESNGLVKHVVLAKFKDGVTDDKIDELIKGYTNLVQKVEPMKTLHWGKDVSIENQHQGLTHVFESTFGGIEGIAEYVAHLAHVEFVNKFMQSADKILIVDYKPTAVKL